MSTHQSWVYKSSGCGFIKGHISSGSWLGILDLIKVLFNAGKFDEYRMLSRFDAIESQVCLKESVLSLDIER